MIIMKGACKYDTDNADVVKRYAYGSFGDPAGYEEVLYRMRNRKSGKGGYFVYRVGGPASPYPEVQIQRILKDEYVQEFIASHEGK